jgi:hypothetical protein
MGFLFCFRADLVLKLHVGLTDAASTRTNTSTYLEEAGSGHYHHQTICKLTNSCIQRSVSRSTADPDAALQCVRNQHAVIG